MQLHFFFMSIKYPSIVCSAAAGWKQIRCVRDVYLIRNMLNDMMHITAVNCQWRGIAQCAIFLQFFNKFHELCHGQMVLCRCVTFSEYFGFSLPISFHKWSIYILFICHRSCMISATEGGL